MSDNVENKAIGNFILQGILSTAQRGINNQVVREGDYYNEQGLLVCGKCGQLRQKIQHYDEETVNCPGGVDFKVTTRCSCDEAEAAEKEKREQEAKDEKLVQSLKRVSLMDAKFETASFDNFECNKNNQRNLKICKRYVEKFDEMLENNQGLLLWGDVGTGKSYMAACIANHLLEQKVSVVMTSLVKLLEMIQGDYDEESEIIKRINRTKLVIFDDLGAERSTDYALEKIYNIIDSRYRADKPMIFTTNLSITQMKKESDIRYSRIYDRIFESCYPIQFTGTSWRKKAAADRFDKMKSLLEE